MDPISGKQIGEPFSIGEQPPLKKHKNDLSFSMSDLPDVPLRIIASFLPTSKDLLVFEQLFREAVYCTVFGWKKHIQQERIDFSWSLPVNEQFPVKACYLHGKVLSVYIVIRERLVLGENDAFIFPTVQQVRQLFCRFQGIMERYPSSLGAFLWKDLNSLQDLRSSYHDRLFQRDFSVESTAGDLLLKGLSYLTEHAVGQDGAPQQNLRRSAFKSLKEAISKGATYANSLAIPLLFGKYRNESWHYELALLSIDKGDYRALEIVLSEFPNMAQERYDLGISHPPILVSIARWKPPQEEEPLFDEAIKGYKDFVPPVVYSRALFAKFSLRKWEEAKDYCTKAIAAYGNETPGYVYAHAAVVEAKLNKWHEANDYYDKAIAACGHQRSMMTLIEDHLLPMEIESLQKYRTKPLDKEYEKN